MLLKLIVQKSINDINNKINNQISFQVIHMTLTKTSKEQLS